MYGKSLRGNKNTQEKHWKTLRENSYIGNIIRENTYSRKNTKGKHNKMHMENTNGKYIWKTHTEKH